VVVPELVGFTTLRSYYRDWHGNPVLPCRRMARLIPKPSAAIVSIRERHTEIWNLPAIVRGPYSEPTKTPYSGANFAAGDIRPVDIAIAVDSRKSGVIRQ
jgi:hypothetical protein